MSTSSKSSIDPGDISDLSHRQISGRSDLRNRHATPIKFNSRMPVAAQGVVVRTDLLPARVRGQVRLRRRCHRPQCVSNELLRSWIIWKKSGHQDASSRACSGRWCRGIAWFGGYGRGPMVAPATAVGECDNALGQRTALKHLPARYLTSKRPGHRRDDLSCRSSRPGAKR